jgi:hypothetical protein
MTDAGSPPRSGQPAEDQRVRGSFRKAGGGDWPPTSGGQSRSREIRACRRGCARRGPRLSTCVYTIVVLTSACPSSSCTVRMSYPSSSRCVANECRKVCGPTRFVMPPFRAACATAFCKTDSCRWKRVGGPHFGSVQTRDAGNTNCHAHSVGAFGYLRSSANGSTTRPKPRARSASCCRFTNSRWRASGSMTAVGNTVGRSFWRVRVRDGERRVRGQL